MYSQNETILTSRKEDAWIVGRIQINSPTRCKSFTSLLLDVSCRSTCFGHLHAHHQELTTALTASGFTLECGGSSVVSRGLAGYDWPDHDKQHCYHNAPK